MTEYLNNFVSAYRHPEEYSSIYSFAWVGLVVIALLIVAYIQGKRA